MSEHAQAFVVINGNFIATGSCLDTRIVPTGHQSKLVDTRCGLGGCEVTAAIPFIHGQVDLHIGDNR